MKSWYKMKRADDVRGEILIYDVIGKDSWTGEGLTAKDFDRDLKALGDVSALDVRINSPGGDVFDGLAIYNMLDQHAADVTVHIDGIAASAASLVAMAGDKIVMPDNAFMMIHKPRTIAIGTDDEMKAAADDLGRMNDSFSAIYAKRSAQEQAAVNALMKEDRLMTATEAKSLGYCDELTGAVKMTAAFDLKLLPAKARLAMTAALPRPDEQKEADRIAAIRDLGARAKTDAAVIEAAITSGVSKKEFSKAVMARLIEEKDAAAAKAPVAAITPAAPITTPLTAYGSADIEETLMLCSVAGVATATAQKFITAKTPIAKVREQLIAAKADAGDRHYINRVDVSAIDEKQASEARMASWRETQARVKDEMGLARK